MKNPGVSQAYEQLLFDCRSSRIICSYAGVYGIESVFDF